MIDRAIRPATALDLEAILDLAQARRQQYAGYQPAFWRPAADAVQRQRPYLARLIDDEGVLTLVSGPVGEITGYLVGQLVSAPPVYDPGGLTCLIDDFAVLDAADWATLGSALLRAAQDAARPVARRRSSWSVGTSTRQSEQLSREPDWISPRTGGSDSSGAFS